MPHLSRLRYHHNQLYLLGQESCHTNISLCERTTFRRVIIISRPHRRWANSYAVRKVAGIPYWLASSYAPLIRAMVSNHGHINKMSTRKEIIFVFALNIIQKWHEAPFPDQPNYASLPPLAAASPASSASSASSNSSNVSAIRSESSSSKGLLAPLGKHALRNCDDQRDVPHGNVVLTCSRTPKVQPSI